jgi:uncharacterized membrane protein
VTNILQLALAFIYVLFVPGFAMTLAVFPRLNQLEITERVALSIGLSLTIVIAMGLLLGYSQTLIAATGGITAYSLLFGIGFVTVFFLVIWALRRANLAVADSREAARPERDMVLDARTAKPVRPEDRTQAEVRPREPATPAAARREDARRRRKEYPPKRGP